MQIKKDERNEIKSTSHSRYRCQYHIVFAPKYRRKEIYGQLKKGSRPDLCAKLFAGFGRPEVSRQ